MNLKKETSLPAKMLIALLFTLTLVMLLLQTGVAKFNVLGHNVYDSYAWQAMLWRDGHVSVPLAEYRSWLELAVYNDRVFISFPPFPTVPMLVLTFFFGEDTPSNLVVILYWLFGAVFSYLLAQRYTKNPVKSLAWGLFMGLGNSLLAFSMYGGVWNQGQLLCWLLTLVSLFCMTSKKRAAWHAGLIAIACAVGCRPLQVIYVPVMLWMLYENLRDACGTGAAKTDGSAESMCPATATPPETALPSVVAETDVTAETGKAAQPAWQSVLLRMIPYCIVPLCIALGYGAYNFVRFGDPFEFGHNYLEEFLTSEHGQFSLHYFWPNLQRLFILPWLDENHRLMFEGFNGFAFYINLPLYVIFFVLGVRSAIRREFTLLDTLLFVTPILHVAATLLHKTLGGWHFGVRYLCDMLPIMLLFVLRKQGEQPIPLWIALCMIFGAAFNIYGAALFYILML